MKKLFLLLITGLTVLCSYSQSVVQRSSPSNTPLDPNLFVGRSFKVPVFDDTLSANTQFPTLDSAGKIIFTRDVNWYWGRQTSPSRKWVPFTGTSIVNIFNNSITNISFFNQVDSSVTILICTGANSCDTISFVTNISNIDTSSVHFIDSTHFVICGIDTVGGNPVTTCDTVTIPTQQLYTFQNWTYQPVQGIVEAGTNPLIHNTTFPTGYFHADIGGYPVYNYPIRFYQDQSWSNGSGIVSFRSAGQTLYGQLANRVRLGVNYWGDTLSNIPYLTGYFGANRVGYGIGPNISSNGSYGQNQDDTLSKNGGIFFHTIDPENDEGVSIYAMPAQTSTYVNGISNYFNAHFRTNGDIRFPFYPISRNDGTAGRFLTTDSAGNMKMMSIPTSDSCGVFTPGTVTVDSFDVSLNKFIVDVSPSSYALCCDNVYRTTDFDTLQLANVDTGYLRYDAIILGVNGVEVVQGIQSTSPSQPQLDSCQELLTYIFITGPHDTVAATINICQNVVFDDNTGTPLEFQQSSIGVVTNPDNTTTYVAHGTKSLDVGNWTNGQSFRFIYNTTVDVSNDFAFKFYIRLKAVLSNTPRIRIDYLNGNTVVTTNTVDLGGATQFGFNRSVLTPQVVTIPMSAWVFTSNLITTVRFTLTGTGSGFYIDWIQFQGCSITPSPAPNNIHFASGNAPPLFTTSVVNPTTNIQQSFTLTPAPPYTVFGNPVDTTSTPQYFTINLSTPQTIGLLDVERIAPCGEGYFIATIDGVQTCVPDPTTDINQVIVLPPLRIDTTDNVLYDTLSLVVSSSVTPTDSALVYDYADSTLKMRPVNASSQTLQQTFDTEIGGSYLTKIDSIQAVSFAIRMFGSNTSELFKAVNTGSGGSVFHGIATSGGIAVWGESTGGTAVYGITTDGNGVYGAATNNGGIGVRANIDGTGGWGVYSQAQDGNISILGQLNSSSTNTVSTVYQLLATSTGTAADGLGGSFDFLIKSANGSQRTSNQIISEWKTADDPTRTAKFSITGVFGGTIGTLLTLNGDKSIQLTPITATAASAITPAEGMLVFVSNTDATFVTIGLWCYQNGAWKAL